MAERYELFESELPQICAPRRMDRDYLSYVDLDRIKIAWLEYHPFE